MLFATFNNSYAALPAAFYQPQAPVPVVAPELIVFNEALAANLGIDQDSANLAAIFSGNSVPEGATPIAQAYAGHQFGHFVPQLGDGRAVLLGEIIDNNGNHRDLQLKGSGQTPFSRRGDGRAALGPVVREYLVSEAMHRLGIPTTRSLAAVTTGEPVFRDERLPGAVLARVASSHLRVGTFQYFAAKGDWKAVNTLYEYARDRHYPEASTPLEFLQAVCTKQAELVAKWLCIGFIHGVMNTDNCSIAGETIDYGPCAFMDEYDPQTIFSSIDRNGRYAYANQPTMAQWNLSRLAECLLPLLPEKNDEIALASIQEVLASFAPTFQQAWQQGMRQKLGLAGMEGGDAELVGTLLQVMQQQRLDFTNTFRQLYQTLVVETPGELGEERPRKDLSAPQPKGLPETWVQVWRKRLKRETIPLDKRLAVMKRANPAIIPRNHQVEKVIAAAYQGTFGPFHALHQALQAPFDNTSENAAYTSLPTEKERVLETFCGT